MPAWSSWVTSGDVKANAWALADKVFSMKVSEEWAALHQFLIDPKRHAGAPRAVYAAVSSLVDPADVKATVVRCSDGPPTVWTVYTVTDDALAFAEVEFQDASYTREEEDDRLQYETRRRKSTLDMRGRVRSTRRLASVLAD